MATDGSLPGPEADCDSTSCDPAACFDPSETPVMKEDSPEKTTESCQSPPTSTAPKKIGFSISSILEEDGTKPVSDRRQVDGLTAEARPSAKNESDQLTFFYREKLLSSQKAQRSSDDGSSADALISSWSPISPVLYREFTHCSSP